MLFAPLNEIALNTLANHARLDVARLAQIQTPAGWVMPRPGVAVLLPLSGAEPADVTVPRWKRAWLDPTASYCDEHGGTLGTVPASITQRAGNMEQLLKSVSRYHRESPETHRRPLY